MSRAVVDGVPAHFSVSALEKADTRPGRGGCVRRWWYRYVGGKDQEERDAHAEAKKRGEQLHAEVAHYLKTGENLLGSLALRGMHMIPEPGPDLLVEHAFGDLDGDLVSIARDAVIEGRLLEAGAILREARALSAAGVPLKGKVDVAHARGINKGGTDVGDTVDPPGTIELID